MAKKKTTRAADGTTRKKRHRRSPEEIITDLEEEIKRLRTKAATKKLKQSPAIKAAMAAVRNLDKALDEAAKENNSLLRHALADARKALSSYFDAQGMRLPKARLPKGPRPKPGA